MQAGVYTWSCARGGGVCDSSYLAWSTKSLSPPTHALLPRFDERKPHRDTHRPSQRNKTSRTGPLVRLPWTCSRRRAPKRCFRPSPAQTRATRAVTTCVVRRPLRLGALGAARSTTVAAPASEVRFRIKLWWIKCTKLYTKK